ncbi:MAG: phosphatidylglycerophosphatase A [Candidatus Omnitrophica bacterium]|nr:phosphatidylglycerophosphatase A [Candidatus Omnitrophota bacterium]
MEMRNFMMKAFATVFGVGYLPAAPGTWATLAGTAVAYYTSYSLPVYTVVALVLLVLGLISTGIMAKEMGQKDPGCLCIDEVVGVMIALWGLPLIWPVMVCGFFLFRAFDMFKIYPINRLEGLNGGWGIMLDDCMAGVYTNIILRIALRYAGLF